MEKDINNNVGHQIHLDEAIAQATSQEPLTPKEELDELWKENAYKTIEETFISINKILQDVQKENPEIRINRPEVGELYLDPKNQHKTFQFQFKISTTDRGDQ